MFTYSDCSDSNGDVVQPIPPLPHRKSIDHDEAFVHCPSGHRINLNSITPQRVPLLYYRIILALNQYPRIEYHVEQVSIWFLAELQKFRWFVEEDKPKIYGHSEVFSEIRKFLQVQLALQGYYVEGKKSSVLVVFQVLANVAQPHGLDEHVVVGKTAGYTEHHCHSFQIYKKNHQVSFNSMI